VFEYRQDAVLHWRNALRRTFFHEQGDMDLVQTADQEAGPFLQRLVVPIVPG
jgi:hypothetical protein